MTTLTSTQQEDIHTYINSQWDTTVIPTLCSYIKIPNVSPIFDDNWHTNGYLEEATTLLADWAKSIDMNCQVDVLHEPDRTPLIFIEIPPTEGQGEGKENTILMYGHLDKQPPLTEDWRDGLGPYVPVIEDGKVCLC